MAAYSRLFWSSIVLLAMLAAIAYILKGLPVPDLVWLTMVWALWGRGMHGPTQ